MNAVMIALGNALKAIAKDMPNTIKVLGVALTAAKIYIDLKRAQLSEATKRRANEGIHQVKMEELKLKREQMHREWKREDRRRAKDVD